jgi:hypothetical protein
MMQGAPFFYTTNNGSITIRGYTGPGGALTIPESINGLPVTSIEYGFYNCASLTSVTIPNSVTSIGTGAFEGCTSLTNVTIPNSVKNIGDVAFDYCTSLTNIAIPNSVTNIGDEALQYCVRLTGIYFFGNAPRLGDPSVFAFDNNATVYYLAGTTGWGSTFGGLPAVLWNPAIQSTNASFGGRTNRFGFNIVGTPNIPIVVEASTHLQGASWTSLQSCSLTNGSIYFSDPQWTNYRGRFYRLRSP